MIKKNKNLSLSLSLSLSLLQIISASQTLALHPSSKIAKENLEVFCEAWESQLCDMALLLREIADVTEGRRGTLCPGTGLVGHPTCSKRTAL